MRIRRAFSSIAVLAAVGCTNDYDAFLQGAGGGASSGSSSSQTSGGSSTSGDATSTSSSGAPGSSGSGGDGGDGTTGSPSSTTSSGVTGTGGAGGSGSGGGGTGGAFPGETPCPGLELPPEPDSSSDFGTAWSEFLSADPAETEARNDDGSLTIDVDTSTRTRSAEIRTNAEPLAGCSVSISLDALNVGAINEGSDFAVAYVGAAPESGDRQGFEVRLGDNDSCTVHLRETFGVGNLIAPFECPPLGWSMRVRHTGQGRVCFDRRLGGTDWVQLACIDADPTVGATIGFASNDSTRAFFGGVNAP